MNYYNEFDPKAAAWLRELIKEGHIPYGYVDERSILDVRPHELTPYCQQHFFAGIGGWSLALKLARYPSNRRVWTGSCPCQPFSAAGKGLGVADPRHLWPQLLRLIAACRPPVVFGEQVASKAGRLWLAGVRADLEALGYAVGASDLCSAGVGSPNIRQRLYWVANAQGQGRDGMEPERAEGVCERTRLGGDSTAGGLADTSGERFELNPERFCEEIGSEQQTPFGADACGCGRSGGMADTDDRGRTEGRIAFRTRGKESLAQHSCDVGGVAHANGGLSGYGELQPSRQFGLVAEDGGALRMADAVGDRGRSGQPGCQDAGDAGKPGEADARERERLVVGRLPRAATTKTEHRHS